jgi:hypothetical protein
VSTSTANPPNASQNGHNPAPDPQTQTLNPNTAPVPAVNAQPVKKGNFFTNWLVNIIADHVVDSGLVGRGTSQQGPIVINEDADIAEIAIHAGMTVGELVTVLSQATGDDEEVINSFEEDAEHPAGVAVRNTWITFFYVVPPIAALAIGLAVGVNFAGDKWLSFQGIAIMIMCVIFEAVPVLLMLATAKLISNVMSGVRKALGSAIVTGLFFVIIALGSSAAQWTLFEGKVDMTDFVALTGAGIRTFALPLAEIAGAIALPILRRKSLDEHLATIKKKSDAKIAINTTRIKSRLDVISAAMRTKADLQKEDDYQKKNDLANRLIDLVTGKIIKDAERSMNEDSSSNGYRRDGYR